MEGWCSLKLMVPKYSLGADPALRRIEQVAHVTCSVDYIRQCRACFWSLSVSISSLFELRSYFKLMIDCSISNIKSDAGEFVFFS